jgi:predicted transcriptional regulator of viral defense system
MRHSARDKLVLAFQKGSAFTLTEARNAGISSRTLYRLCESGDAIRLSRGVFQAVDASSPASPDYASIAKRVPKGVLCLVSALYHHELSTEIPRTVHLAIHRNASIPKLDFPKLRVFRMSSPSFDFGVEQAVIDGVELQVYSREKTIADCFKYRNRLGVDLAVEALRYYMTTQDRNPGLVLEMAAVCRVAKIIRPYLEALV